MVVVLCGGGGGGVCSAYIHVTLDRYPQPEERLYC